MKTLFEGDHLLVRETEGWQFVERKKGKSAVAVIALADDDTLILTEQLRKPVNARVIDWPAGLVGDEDESADPESTAVRELEEETGYACQWVELLARGTTSPGITSETISLYRAHGVTKKGEGGGVSGEDITVHLVPRNQIREWLHGKEKEGMLIDVKLWSGLYFLSV